MLSSIVLGSGLFALLVAADPPTPQAPPTPSSGQVRGTISYGRHAPAVGAIVVMRPESATSPVRVATTGTSGTFAFDGLRDGSYRAEVRREGYAPVVKSGIQVRAPFRAVVEVLLVRGAALQEAAREAQAADGSASLTGAIRVAGGALSPTCQEATTAAPGERPFVGS